jgi:hypothetical protein
MSDQPKKRGRGRPRKNNTEPQKKKGRKKNIEKTSVYDLKKIHMMNEKILHKSIIVHLPIDINLFTNENKLYVNDFLNYESRINFEEPTGYNIDSMDNNSLLKLKEEDIANNEEKDEIEYKLYDNKKLISKKINNIMVDFINFKNQKYFNTNICCWWCCHKFENIPCGIPISYDEKIFNLKGCFCSFNCALSYNYNEKININKIQERESLLRMMYKKIHNTDVDDLEYAPDKESLKMFGGHLSIDEFRSNKKIYNIIYPPMSYIIPQLEEIKVINDINNNLVNNLNKVTKSSQNGGLSKLFGIKN